MSRQRSALNEENRSALSIADMYCCNSFTNSNSYLLQVYLYLGVGFCTAFIILNGFCKRSWALSKPLVIYMGLFNSIVATLASWGFIMYCGINDWQAINLASGFLLLGVGKYFEIKLKNVTLQK